MANRQTDRPNTRSDESQPDYGIEYGVQNRTPDPSADSSISAIMNLLSKYGGDKKHESEWLSIMQLLIQRGFDLDARDYNSVTSQVERLMAAGMSRTQALLTATAGEAQVSPVNDLVSGNVADQQVQLQKAQMGLGIAGSTLSFLAGNYGTIFQMAGDIQARPVFESIARAEQSGSIPDVALADNLNFRRWIDGNLHDSSGNPIPRPKEIVELANSPAWYRLKSSPAGNIAFDRYLNSHFSARGYKEMYSDAVVQRKLNRLNLVCRGFDSIMQQPFAIESACQTMLYDLQGISFTAAPFNSNDTDWDSTPPLYISDMVDSEGNVNPYSLLNVDGTLREDVAPLMQAIYDEFNERVQTAAYMSSPEGIMDAFHDIANDRDLQLVATQLDIINKRYMNEQTKAETTMLVNDSSHTISGQNDYNRYVPQWLQRSRDFLHAWKALGGKSGLSAPSVSSDNIKEAGNAVAKTAAVKGGLKLVGKALLHF